MDKRWVIRFKPPETRTDRVFAATAEVRKGFLVLTTAAGEHVGLFDKRIIESWDLMDADEP